MINPCLFKLFLATHGSKAVLCIGCAGVLAIHNLGRLAFLAQHCSLGTTGSMKLFNKGLSIGMRHSAGQNDTILVFCFGSGLF